MRTTGGADSSPSGHRPGAFDLGEEMCRVQAGMLDMGEDNYQRLCRVCPDPDRRYRVLQRRFTHRVRTALASSQPPWRQATPAAVLPAGGGVEVVLDWQGRAGSSGRDPASPDAYAPGPSARAETCWRCDARAATDDVGLCEPCHTALSTR